MPSFLSFPPKLTSGSVFWTTNAEMPRVPWSGSVTAMTFAGTPR